MAVRKPEDVLKGRRHLLEKAARDLGADQLERVRQLLERWDDKARKDLFDMLGEERAKKLLKDLGVL